MQILTPKLISQISSAGNRKWSFHKIEVIPMHYPSTRTKLVILLGHPLGHTLSPAMHNRSFEKLGLDYLYMPVEVSADNLKTVFSGLMQMNVAGFNVTVPHKIRIIDLLDEIDPLAEVIGAVNTICVNEGKSLGYNTDGEGFLTYLQTQLATSIKNKTVFILGGGGAARGIAMTLAFRGASKVFLCNRTENKAIDLAGEINAKISPCAQAIPKNAHKIEKALTASDILVNTTSVGMHPNSDVLPIDKGFLHRGLAVVDIVYNPLITSLLKAAQKVGCPTVDGLGMLVYQGALAFKLWTGIEPIAEEMFSAANQAMV
jgi:shikimate dehydrogenase